MVVQDSHPFRPVRNLRSSLPIFFFNDTATTEIYTLSLHDALPIYDRSGVLRAALLGEGRLGGARLPGGLPRPVLDRKSTRLNSSHQIISYAVFCLKKKNNPTFSPAELVTTMP